jgi:hypothetical protein
MRLPIALLAAALATGCADLTTNEINVQDRGVFLPEGRLSIDISPRGESPPAVPHTGHAIELMASGGSGEDDQNLGAGENPVVFGGRTFGSPVALHHEAEFRFASIAYRYRHFFGAGKTFGIEGMGGLGFAELDLDVSSATTRASDKLSSGGLVGAFGIIWKFFPTTALHSRIMVFGSGDNEGVSVASRLDLYISQSLGSHFLLRAGWATWGVHSAREFNSNLSSGNSPINVRFSGPALGLDLAF